MRRWAPCGALFCALRAFGPPARAARCSGPPGPRPARLRFAPLARPLVPRGRRAPPGLGRLAAAPPALLRPRGHRAGAPAGLSPRPPARPARSSRALAPGASGARLECSAAGGFSPAPLPSPPPPLGAPGKRRADLGFPAPFSGSRKSQAFASGPRPVCVAAVGV